MADRVTPSYWFDSTFDPPTKRMQPNPTIGGMSVLDWEGYFAFMERDANGDPFLGCFVNMELDTPVTWTITTTHANHMKSIQMAALLPIAGNLRDLGYQIEAYPDDVDVPALIARLTAIIAELVEM